MFKFKKLVAAVCGLALALTATMVPFVSASAAEGVGFGLSDGTKAATAKYNYITVDITGLNGSLASDGTVSYRVTKGVYSAASKVDLEDEGMWDVDAEEGPTFSVILNTTYSDDYDLLTVSWAGAGSYTTDLHLVGARLTIANAGEAIFTPDMRPAVVISVDGQETQYNSSSATTQYKLAADSNKVTVYEAAPPAPAVEWVTADVQDFSSEVDNSVAVAAKATLENESEEAFDTVTWKVTKDEVVKGRRSALKTVLDGPGTVTVGLAIGGITSDGLTVEAALGAQGN